MSTASPTNPVVIAGSVDETTAPKPVRVVLNPLCGGGSCIPGDKQACIGLTVNQPVVVPADAGSADAGVGDAGLSSLTAADAGVEQTTVSLTCQVRLTDSFDVERACLAPGDQSEEEACHSSDDCGPGLACVGMQASGRCQRLCCGSADWKSCGVGSFCAQRPLREESLGAADGPLVPVCTQADNCSLGDCPAGQSCGCRADKTCTVVGSGTTACVVPGLGTAGDDCVPEGEPVSDATERCASGYMCSTDRKCLKLCDLSLGDGASCRSDSRCQAQAHLPEGWGVCVL